MKVWILTLATFLISLSTFANEAKFELVPADGVLTPMQIQGLPEPLPDDGNSPEPQRPHDPRPPQYPGNPNPGNQYYNYNFGQVPVNSVRSANFYLRSTGSGNLYLNRIDLYGQGFYGNANCPHVLPPGYQCNVWVQFRPWYQGSYSGQLIFRTSAGNFIVNLYGWGTRW